ncbi:MAG TPA: D-alanyl-D-alanine carboxypeptidase [Fibrobacteria bacterium]|nr:D-alanyl-D-alanine carboxypeptidase [Fibrobacteria bacterium]
MTDLPRGPVLIALVLAGCAANRPLPKRDAAPRAPQADTLVLHSICPPCPPPPRCPAPPDPRWRDLPVGADTALWTALDSLARADYLSQGGLLGAYVVRLGDTLPMWRHDADARLLPASTEKLFTAAVALSELGPGFRWRTTLWASGPIVDSVLHGDLLLEGGGDPTLGMSDGTGLGGLAVAARNIGIRRVHGNLVAVDTIVGRGPDAWPQGWTINSSRDGYGAPVLGLDWDQNKVGDHAIAEPRPRALKAMRAELLAKGVRVLGSDTALRARGDTLGRRRNWTRVGTVYSPELEPVLRVCLRESVNPFAEAMLLGLGMGGRGPARESGRKRIQEWLASRGVDQTRMLVDDGCGLSRYDLASARQMARLLAMDARNGGTRLVSVLPTGGEGTLRHRFQNLPDPTVVVAKTGTLDGVSNLAGYLVRPGRDTLAFAFLCNGFTGSPRPVRQFQDRMIALLAGVPLVPTTLDTLDTLESRPEMSDSTLSGKRSLPHTPFQVRDTAKQRPDTAQAPKPVVPAPEPLDSFPSGLDRELPGLP